MADEQSPMEFDAEKRYQSLADMKEDLESLQHGVQRDMAVIMNQTSANGGYFRFTNKTCSLLLINENMTTSTVTDGRS